MRQLQASSSAEMQSFQRALVVERCPPLTQVSRISSRQTAVLLNESRNEALQRMMMQAHSMGANGIVNVRFATSNVAAGASELFCYGTAVVIE